MHLSFFHPRCLRSKGTGSHNCTCIPSQTLVQKGAKTWRRRGQHSMPWCYLLLSTLSNWYLISRATMSHNNISDAWRWRRWTWWRRGLPWIARCKISLRWVYTVMRGSKLMKPDTDTSSYCCLQLSYRERHAQHAQPSFAFVGVTMVAWGRNFFFFFFSFSRQTCWSKGPKTLQRIKELDSLKHLDHHEFSSYQKIREYHISSLFFGYWNIVSIACCNYLQWKSFEVALIHPWSWQSKGICAYSLHHACLFLILLFLLVFLFLVLALRQLKEQLEKWEGHNS